MKYSLSTKQLLDKRALLAELARKAYGTEPLTKEEALEHSHTCTLSLIMSEDWLDEKIAKYSLQSKAA